MSLLKWVISGPEARLINLITEEKRIRKIIEIEEANELVSITSNKPGLRVTANWVPTPQEKELIIEFYFAKIGEGLCESDAAHEVRKTFRRASSFQPIYIERWQSAKVPKKRGRRAIEDNAYAAVKWYFEKAREMGLHLPFTLITDMIVENDNIEVSRSTVYRIFKQLGGTILSHPASRVPADWEDKGEEMFRRLCRKIAKHKVPADLVFNYDETPIQYVTCAPVCDGLRGQGSESGHLFAQDDKRMATIMTTCTPTRFLQPIVVWSGKEGRSGACCDTDVLQIQTANHYVSTLSIAFWLDRVILPAIAEYERRTHYINVNAVVLWDCCSVHLSADTKVLLQHPRYRNVKFVLVPPRCTSKLQPLDRRCFSTIKARIRRKQCTFYWNLLKEDEAPKSSTQLSAHLVKKTVSTHIHEVFRELMTGPTPSFLTSAWRHIVPRIFDRTLGNTIAANHPEYGTDNECEESADDDDQVSDDGDGDTLEVEIDERETQRIAEAERKRKQRLEEAKAKSNEAIVALKTLPKVKPELCAHVKACLMELSVHPDFFAAYVDAGLLHCCHVRWTDWSEIEPKKASKAGLKFPTYKGLRERCKPKHCIHCSAVYFADSTAACDKHLLPCETCLLR